jgi:TPR repeat protein
MEAPSPKNRSHGGQNNVKTNGFIGALACAAAIAMTPQGAGASAEQWLQADEAYAADHFAAALEIYLQLALSGDARAAELAGQMLFMGERLYGAQVVRDLGRAIELLTQAKRAGRPIAEFLLEPAQPAHQGKPGK